MDTFLYPFYYYAESSTTCAEMIGHKAIAKF